MELDKRLLFIETDVGDFALAALTQSSKILGK